MHDIPKHNEIHMEWIYKTTIWICTTWNNGTDKVIKVTVTQKSGVVGHFIMHCVKSIVSSWKPNYVQIQSVSVCPITTTYNKMQYCASYFFMLYYHIFNMCFNTFYGDKWALWTSIKAPIKGTEYETCH